MRFLQINYQFAGTYYGKSQLPPPKVVACYGLPWKVRWFIVSLVQGHLDRNLYLCALDILRICESSLRLSRRCLHNIRDSIDDDPSSVCPTVHSAKIVAAIVCPSESPLTTILKTLAVSTIPYEYDQVVCSAPKSQPSLFDGTNYISVDEHTHISRHVIF